MNPEHTYQEKGQYAITLEVKDRKGQIFKSTSSQKIIVTVLNRPPFWLKYAACGLYLVLMIGWKLQPLQKRRFRYQVNDEPRRTHKSWRKDKKFLWREGEFCRQDVADYTDGFEVISKRNFFLAKRYYFRALAGNVRATKKNEKTLTGGRMAAKTLVRIGDHMEVQISGFNDGWLPWLVPHLCIVASVLLVFIFALQHFS